MPIIRVIDLKIYDRPEYPPVIQQEESTQDIGKLVFSQVMDFMSMHTFRRCVTRYQGITK